MRQRFDWPPGWLFAVVLAFVLAACGGDSSEDDTPNDPIPQQQAPHIHYAVSQLAVEQGVPINVAPDNDGGAVTSWTVSPALPDGLSLDAATGAITGTATTIARSTTHTVTATNEAGSSTFSLALFVQQELLDAGHNTTVIKLRVEATRVLSQDLAGHWIIWDRGGGNIVASGDSDCGPDGCESQPDSGYGDSVYLPVDMAGDTVVVQLKNGLQVRSAANGNVLFETQSTVFWWTIATDGGYVAAADEQGITAWTRDGQAVLIQPGDYQHSKPFAAPDALRVANGAKGSAVIEKLSLTDFGSTQTPSFMGNFHSWFTDGQRFITTVSNLVRVYSRDGELLSTQTLPTVAGLTGQGKWLTTFSTTLNVSPIDGSAVPAATFSLDAPYVLNTSRGTVAVLYFDNRLTIVDLTGDAPQRTDLTLPPLITPYAYAADDDQKWFVASTLLLDGSSAAADPRYFGSGGVLSLAGWSGGVVVATGKGELIQIDFASGQQHTLRDDFVALQIELSLDGSVLGFNGYAADGPSLPRSLTTVSLPSQVTLGRWDEADGFLLDFALSPPGTAVGRLVETGSSGNYHVTVSGVHADPVWAADFANRSSSDPPRIRLSGDTGRFGVYGGASEDGVFTSLYDGTQLSNVVPGKVVGWIGEQWMVGNFSREGSYTGMTLYDAGGETVRSSSLPEISHFEPIDVDRIYSPERNAVLSVSTGKTLWSDGDKPRSGTTVQGTLAGASVVYMSGSRLLRAAY